MKTRMWQDRRRMNIRLPGDNETREVKLWGRRRKRSTNRIIDIATLKRREKQAKGFLTNLADNK